MGQNSSSISIKNYTARIETNDEKIFKISYHALVEHIFLLRKVIRHPEMTKDGPILDNFIKDYCKRMGHGEMKTKDQQLKLRWEIEWIWHVHRLHPLDYLNDCEKQLSEGLVDRKAEQLLRNSKKTNRSKMIFPMDVNQSLFVPSIDLKNAIIRQNDFLNKFQKHFLYSYDLQEFNELRFLNLIQDYVSFVKLARKSQMIVPTFDIDLIWHTHMRYPLEYHTFSKALCGFILDHNDLIESSILTDAYQKTADRWKQTYQSEYGTNVDRKNLLTSRYQSSCAMVFSPIFISTTTATTERPIHAAWLIGCSTSCGGGASSSDIGDNSGGCASGGNGTDSGGGDADGGGGGGGDDGGGCGGGCGGN